jgi:hypothetical protein
MNESKTEICRTITLQIPETTEYGGLTGRIVSRERVPRERTQTANLLETLLPGKKVESLGRKELMVIGYGTPSPSSLFFQAVHACFDSHYALTLRPEVLMHLIVNEVATAVHLHPEEYRSLFTSSDSKELIKVRHDGLVLGDPSSPWYEAIALFEAPLREKVPPGIMEHILPTFSTSTIESRTASLVAFMAAASKFYDYRVSTMCGIPEIRLAGKPDDYRKVLTAAAQLAEPFRPHLGKYFDHLLPVLKQLADQAAGAPLDHDFWTSIYKFKSDSGSDRCNGWITSFVNYIQTSEAKASSYSRPLTGAILQKSDDLFDWNNPYSNHRMRGLSLGSVPSQISIAPFTWQYFNQESKMLFAGGVLGIDDSDDSIMPVLSYAILHDE